MEIYQERHLRLVPSGYAVDLTFVPSNKRQCKGCARAVRFRDYRQVLGEQRSLAKTFLCQGEGREQTGGYTSVAERSEQAELADQLLVVHTLALPRVAPRSF